VGIDFADMIYLPLVWNLLSKDYQLVVGDEVQDFTLAQLEILERICCGRLCLVGDDRQAIYGFRGADSSSLDRLKRKLKAQEMGLKTTYRCGNAIVVEAQKLVPDILAGPTNPQGWVGDTDYSAMLGTVAPGDFILSRLNAPLVSCTLQLLQRGIRAQMKGRDIGAGIIRIVKSLKVMDSTPVDELLAKLQTWESKMVTRFAAYGQPDLADKARDQAAMVFAFAEQADDCGALIAQIEHLFSDGDDGSYVWCSSVHKAKGLEAHNVFVMRESFYRYGESPEEQNIDYVATTRAKSKLYRVYGVPTLQRRARG
jgi:superfamily I DNA/RNA helicase